MDESTIPFDTFKCVHPLLLYSSTRRLRIILSYLHFFSKSSLELICSRIFFFFFQFQWLRDTTGRFKDIQQNILSYVLFSETFYRISTQLSWCSSVSCCMSRESSSLIGRAGDTTVQTCALSWTILSHIQTIKSFLFKNPDYIHE